MTNALVTVVNANNLDVQSYLLTASEIDVVQSGKYEGRPIEQALKLKFVEECMKLDRDANGDELDRAFDNGIFESLNGTLVIAHWPNSV